VRTIPSKPTSFTRPLTIMTAGLVVLVAVSGCLSPHKKVAQRLSDVRGQWQTNAVRQAQLPVRALDWNAAVASLREGNLKLRRARADVTNAQENVRQIFKNLLPTITVRSGISQSIGEISMTSWDDFFLDFNSFFNIPGLVGLNTSYFAARLSLIRAMTFYELSERDQIIELYKLILAFQEHQEARAALEAEERFATAVRSADDMTGNVLLREAENRDLALIKESDALQQRAGDLFGNRGWRWILSTNGAPTFDYTNNPLPIADTNRIAQLQMRLVAIELVGAWARITGIKLQYWPDLRLFVSGPPVYSRRSGMERFFDADNIRFTADVFWRVDTRGQISRQLRQTRRDQELQIARIRQESLGLIDRLLAAQKILTEVRTEIAELNQLIPVVESVAPPAEFTGIVKAAETRRSLRDQERRLRRELAELNTLFWFVDEQKWSQREKLF
jgi:hypothetical protein